MKFNSPAWRYKSALNENTDSDDLSVKILRRAMLLDKNEAPEWVKEKLSKPIMRLISIYENKALYPSRNLIEACLLTTATPDEISAKVMPELTPMDIAFYRTCFFDITDYPAPAIFVNIINSSEPDDIENHLWKKLAYKQPLDVFIKFCLSIDPFSESDFIMIKNIVLTDRARNMLHHAADKKSRQYSKEIERNITDLTLEHFTVHTAAPDETQSTLKDFMSAVQSINKPQTKMPPEGAVEDVNAKEYQQKMQTAKK